MKIGCNTSILNPHYVIETRSDIMYYYSKYTNTIILRCVDIIEQDVCVCVEFTYRILLFCFVQYFRNNVLISLWFVLVLSHGSGVELTTVDNRSIGKYTRKKKKKKKAF